MIALHFDELSKYPRIGEYAEVAVPFASGILSNAAGASVRSGDRLCPTQTRVTGRWPDGSVRWLLVRFLADLPPAAPAVFSLDTGAGKTVMPDTPVTIGERDLSGRRRIATGRFSATLGGPGETPVAALGLGDWESAVRDAAGPEIECGGRCFLARVGSGGWDVIEAGPVCAILQTEGRHRGENGAECLDFTLQLRFFAGASWFHAEYRVIHREREETLALDRMEWVFRPAGEGDAGGVRTALGHSNYRTVVETGEHGAPLAMCIDGPSLVAQANEQVPETHYGTFWADWTGRRGGLCVTQYQAHQNYPKALKVDGGELRAQILPPGSGGLCLLRGMAKRHRVQVHLHAPGEAVEAIDARSLQYQMPDRPRLAPEVFRTAGVFPGLWVDRPVPAVERRLVDLADERTVAYGILHWGDGPDRGYTNQGRGNGALVWTNNEYDFPHAAMQLYARTGERRFLDGMRVTAEHQMDIDVCHCSDDPLRQGGQVMHSAGHASKHCSPCHEWVEGLIDYVHQTGDAFAWETAVGIAENVLRHMADPRLREPAGAATRVTGWALRTFMAMYVETGESRWREASDRIALQFEEWHRRFGAWVAPYTSHTLVRVPFMMAIAASSLMRYWRVTGNEATRELIVTAVRDIVDNGLMPDGRFYYKQLPSLRRRGAGVYVLEALAYAWELSGDTSFLDAGRVTFGEVVTRGAAETRGWDGPKFEADGAVVVPRGAGPKEFAAFFMPVMAFYRALVEAGLPVPADG